MLMVFVINGDKPMSDQIKALQTKLSRLKDALDIYADKKNWRYIDESGCPKGEGDTFMYAEGKPYEIAQQAIDDMEKSDER